MVWMAPACGIALCQGGSCEAFHLREPSMDQPITVGLDLAKSVFQVHGVDAEGRVVVRRQLRRSRVLGFFERLGPCLVGMEACSGAHHWARELAGFGHEVRLMPPAYVKAYVKRGKTDAADAEAICEAATRPTMRFVPVKSAERQAALLDHKARDFLVRQRTQTVNAIRAHLGEFGIVVAKGIHNVDRLLEAARDVPEAARPALDLLADQLTDLEERIEAATARIAVSQKGRPAGTAARHDPRFGAHRVLGLRGDHARRGGLALCARLRGLARAHPSRAFVWRQGTAGPDFQGGEPLSAPSALPRRHGPDRRPAGAARRPGGSGARLARPDAGQEAGEGRRHRARSAHGPHGLGAHP